ncbi:MAG TPA: SDR family oxidoreductase [Pyrinomonadaceae bacterium]
MEEAKRRRLEGRRALVTGANSGIGRAIALRLGLEGAGVVVNYLVQPEEAEKVVTEIEGAGSKALAINADVSDEGQVEEMFRRAAEALGGLDILVNNAATEMRRPFLEMPLEDWRRVIEVDLTGPFLCSQRAARLMVESGAGGSIVNITSVHQRIPWGGYAHYCAAKAGLEMLTKTIALELATENVRVNSVAPGAIATPLNREVWSEPEMMSDLLNKIPVRRAGEVEEIASVVAFLCSDESSYMTGQTVYVDGGMTLYPAFLRGA